MNLQTDFLVGADFVRVWHTSKSNDISEGFHTKIKMMSHREYGSKNFLDERLRVLIKLLFLKIGGGLTGD